MAFTTRAGVIERLTPVAPGWLTRTSSVASTFALFVAPVVTAAKFWVCDETPDSATNNPDFETTKPKD